MVQIRKKVTLRHWRNSNEALQHALRNGDMRGARQQARTLLSYLGEMGLLDDLDRQGDSPDGSDLHNGSTGETKAKIKNAA